MSVERVSREVARPRPTVVAPRRRRVHLGPTGRGPRVVSAIPQPRPAAEPQVKPDRCLVTRVLGGLPRRWSPTTRRAMVMTVPLIAFGTVSLLAGPAIGAIIIASLFAGAALCRWLDHD
ncbi:hypothetical protein [Allokutzneria oryzae]|uniref:Uncharacterized protein n=1 Tax=Allokutzneria oryzae TaxID=1378989 RepID=A0ABV5ZRN4_9PSEU